MQADDGIEEHVCPACCGNRMCFACRGKGYVPEAGHMRPCGDCNTSGRCGECDGEGKVYLFQWGFD